MTARLVDRRVLATAMAGMGAMALGVRPALAWQEATPAASPEASPAVSLVAEVALPAVPSGGALADGTWEFTDDRGVTVTLPATPTRVIAYIAYAAALHDYGFDVVGYYGAAETGDGTPAPVAGDLPLADIPNIAPAYELDLEAVVATGAELVVGVNYALNTPEPVIWPLDLDTQALLEAAVPVIHIAAADGADSLRTIETVVNLAAALGLATETAAATAEREAFETAAADLAAAIAEKPNLTTLWMAATETGFYALSGYNDLNYYESLGLRLESPGWEEQSWETFGEWQVDLIFNDDHDEYFLTPEEMVETVPTFAAHPAVRAGQVAPWRVEYVPSYRGFTPVVSEVAEWIRNADDSVS